MKIGITGANGHVGSNLIRRLLKDDFELRVMQFHNNQGFEGLDVEVVKSNLDDIESLDKFCAGLDVVYHLAAKVTIGKNSFESVYKTNVDGTKNIVSACKKSGVKRFIYFSSIHALSHEPLDQPMDENKPLEMDSDIAYEKTKALAEEWVLTQQASDFDVIILNPSAIFGPFDFKPSLLGQFFINLYNSNLPAMVPGGYNFVDVRDVCDAASQAIYQGKGGERYILSGHYRTVVDFVELAGQVLDRKIKIPLIPLWIAHVGVPFITAWAKISGQKPIYTKQSLDILQMGNRNISNEKARKELGYKPRPLAESIKDTLNWFKENNYISA